MTIDEMVIAVRVTAEGVKQGVSVAIGELKKLQTEKNKLQEELKIKVSAPELLKLRQELTDLQARKKELDAAVKFPVDSESLKRLKSDLNEVLEEKKMIERDLKLQISLADSMAAQSELERLTREKKRLEEEIKVAVKSDAEAAKKDLDQINRSIQAVESDIVIHMESSGINQASDEIKRLDSEMAQAEQTAAAVAQQMPRIGIAAAAAFTLTVSAVNKGTEAFNQYTQTMNGLASQMDYVGVSMGDAMDVIREKTADGLVSESDIALSIKNLTRYGLTIEQAGQVLDRLKDSATNNREAHYGLGEAIRVTTEGIKNENSRLADAAGVTKNISVMQEEYAKSIGSTANNLTQAEKAQAIYNGIMSETEATTGSAAEYAKTLAGSQAAAEASALKLAQAYGEAVAPSVQIATEAWADFLNGLTAVLSGNQSAVAGITAMAGALSLGIGAVAAYTIAVKAASAASVVLGAASGPVGWLIGGLGALAGATAAMVTATNEQAAAQEELNQKTEAYVELKKSEITVDNLEAKQQAVDEIETLIEQLDGLITKQREADQIQAEMAANAAQYGTALATLTTETVGLEESYNKLVQSASVYGFRLDENLSREENMVAAKEALTKEFEAQSDTITGYNAELTKISNTLDNTAEAMKNLIEPTQKLNDAYQSLSKGESLSADTLLELIELYPSVARHIAENVNWRETLIGVIETEAQVSKAATLAELNARKNELIAAKAKLVGVSELSKAEAQTYNAMLADVKSGIKNFADFVGEAVNAIRTKGLLGAGVEAVTAAASEAANREVEAINTELATINAQINALDVTLDKGFTTGSASGGRNEKVKTAEDIAKELYDIDKKSYEDQKALSELSLEEQVKQLEALKQKHIDYKDGVVEIEKELYAIRRDLANEWYEERMKAVSDRTRSDAENTDFSSVISALKKNLEEAKTIYAQYPEAYKEIEQEITEAITEAAENRADKLLAREGRLVDERIAQYQRLIEINKNSVGILDKNGDAFDFTAQDESDIYDQIVSVNESRILELEALERQLTDSEFAELQKRIQNRTDYAKKIEDLSITSIKEQQAAEKEALDAAEKLAEAAQKAAEAQIKAQTEAAKAANKILIDSLKERYDEQIRLAEAAADAEAAVYEEKVKEIDDIIRLEERAESNAAFNDRIKRLQEQLKYEKDDGNIYELEKQISLEQSEQEKQNRRESFEDEKIALQEQMEAVKESLSIQKQAIQDRRDAEIKAEEEQLASYIAGLDIRKVKSAETLVEESETIKNELVIREKSEKKHLENLYIQQKESERNRRDLFSRTTDGIINDLYERIADFVSVGSAAGQAFAEAFSGQLSAISGEIETAAGYGGTVTPASVSNATTTTNTFQVSNTFTVPVAQPSKVAAAQIAALESYTRYMG